MSRTKCLMHACCIDCIRIMLTGSLHINVVIGFPLLVTEPMCVCVCVWACVWLWLCVCVCLCITVVKSPVKYEPGEPRATASNSWAAPCTPHAQTWPTHCLWAVQSSRWSSQLWNIENRWEFYSLSPSKRTEGLVRREVGDAGDPQSVMCSDV